MKKLLLIYDLAAQPISIGDVVLFQEAGLIIAKREGCEVVDTAFVYDPKQPTVPDPAFSHINADNIREYLKPIILATQCNPMHGEAFVFSPHAELDEFLRTSDYVAWPSREERDRRRYLYYDIFENVIWGHYQRSGSIPVLNCQPRLRDMAQSLMTPYPKPWVTVNIRNNPGHHFGRNANIESWVRLFGKDATFFLMCARNEIDPSFRRPNVVLTKDHDTTIAEDLALCVSSDFHIGIGSGPITVNLFNQKPYLMAKTYYGEKYFSRDGMIVKDEAFQRFWFSRNDQRIHSTDFPEILSSEFDKMKSSYSGA